MAEVERDAHGLGDRQRQSRRYGRRVADIEGIEAEVHYPPAQVSSDPLTGMTEEPRRKSKFALSISRN